MLLMYAGYHIRVRHVPSLAPSYTTEHTFPYISYIPYLPVGFLCLPIAPALVPLHLHPLMYLSTYLPSVHASCHFLWHLPSRGLPTSPVFCIPHPVLRLNLPRVDNAL